MKNLNHDYTHYSPEEIRLKRPEVSIKPSANIETLNYMRQGYAAAPLLLSHLKPDTSVVLAQKQYQKDLSVAVDAEFAARGIKKSVIEWAKLSILGRTYQREGLNATQFDHRLYDAPVLNYISNFSLGEILSACDAALHGTATIAQARLAQLAYGMASSEYGNVTIIGDTRKDVEKAMWSDLSQLIESDSSRLGENVSRQSVIGYDRDVRGAQDIGAVRIMAKRAIGVRGDFDTEIKVRETVILDTSPSSGFDQSIVQKVIAEANADMDPMQTTAFEPVMQALWNRDMDSHIVLARNETVYGVSHEITKMLAERRDQNLGAQALY